MIQARMSQRGWLAGLLLIGVTGVASAQVFQLSTDPDALKDPTGTSASVRPNTPETRYVFVKNPKGNKAVYTVELRDANNRALLASGKIKLNANELLRVKLEKAPPPPAPKVVAAPPAPTVPPPPAVEPPPGLELKAKNGEFAFVLRLLDEQGEVVLEGKDKPAEARFSVEYRLPDTYFGAPTPEAKVTDGIARFDVSIRSTDQFRGPPAVVELAFPPQFSVAFDKLRAGTYRRTVTEKNQTVKLFADEIPLIEGSDKLVRSHVNIDGYARAFIYRLDYAKITAMVSPTLDRTPAVRVLPADSDRPTPTISAKPGDKTPVRIEVDNPLKNRLALRFDRDKNGAFSGADELIVLGNPREEHVFVEPQGEDEGIVLTYRVTDRVHYLDTRSMRGRFELQGVLLDEKGELAKTKVKDDNGKEEEKDIIYSCYLVLDDTGPEILRFDNLPRTHVKGTPLPLKAFASEPETSVKQAIFFLGKPADGKLPDVKVEGELVDLAKGLWSGTGQLPIPDKRGTIEVGVQFVNETGVTATKTQKIELIDPPTPSGTITGVVELGGLGQPKVIVSLRDGEGKEKGSAVTNAKGEFKFENVAPGTYRLLSNKPDSGVGTKGDAPAQVQIGKETKVIITLARKP